MTTEALMNCPHLGRPSIGVHGGSNLICLQRVWEYQVGGSKSSFPRTASGRWKFARVPE
jgi:hypothetical protein